MDKIKTYTCIKSNGKTFKEEVNNNSIWAIPLISIILTFVFMIIGALILEHFIK